MKKKTQPETTTDTSGIETNQMPDIQLNHIICNSSGNTEKSDTKTDITFLCIKLQN